MQKLAFILCGLALVACSGQVNPVETDQAAATTDVEVTSLPDETALALKTQMENGLTPAVVFDGETVPTYSLDERMGKHNTPAVSIAYAKDGALVWAQAYGEAVDTETRFQAASMSKVVAAVGIVTFALENGISIDQDVDALVPGLDLRSISPEGSSITLRGLLSHTAGATVGGFPGYAVGQTVPSNLDVILGGEDTNTDAVVFTANPDGAFRYSGGGFQIAQAVVEAQSGQPFETTLADLVLTPIGMSSSTFAPIAPGSSSEGIATATNGDGSTVEGGWHVYPEQAAAGLWTTPTEYVDFVFALMASGQDGAALGITEAVAGEILTPVSEAYGLGIGIEDAEGRIRYRHGGSNRGYRCFFMAFPDTGEVFVMMTNSANGSALGAEIIRAAAGTYGWPDAEPKTVSRVDLTDAQLSKFAGAYALPGSAEAYATLSLGDTVLAGTLATGSDFSLVPLSETRFIDPDDGQEITFQDADGVVSLSAGGTTLNRLAAE